MAATPVKTWTKLLGTRSGHSYALTTGLDGSIYVGGSAGGALDGVNVSLTKYSADGTKAWTKLPPRVRDFRFGSFSKTWVFGQALNNTVFVSRADNLDAFTSWN